jgi:hypothetical protein
MVVNTREETGQLRHAEFLSLTPQTRGYPAYNHFLRIWECPRTNEAWAANRRDRTVAARELDVAGYRVGLKRP